MKNLIILIFILIAFSEPAAGKEGKNAKQEKCLEQTFYAVRVQDRKISCGRGKNCKNEKDRGLIFSSDKYNLKCTISFSHGDIGETIYYSRNGSEINIIPRDPSRASEFEKKKFLLSDEENILTNTSFLSGEIYKVKQ